MTEKITMVANRDRMLEAVQFCKAGINTAASSPDSNLLILQTLKNKKQIMMTTFNGMIQCKAVVPLEQPVEIGRKIVVDYPKVNKVLGLTDKGDRLIMDVPADPDGDVPDILHLKNVHGTYDFGLHDPDSLATPRWALKEVGKIDYSILMSLFDMARLIADDTTHFIRFQAVKNAKDDMFLRILTRTNRELAMLTVEAPDVTDEFTIYIPQKTFKNIRNLQTATVHLMLPKNADDSVIGFMNDSKTSQMICGCDIESNADVEDAVAQLKKKPVNNISWDINDMQMTLDRLEFFSTGRLNVLVPAESTDAIVSALNNKHQAEEVVSVDGNNLGEHETSISFQLNTLTMKVLHKLDTNSDRVKMQYQQIEGNEPNVGLVTGKSDDVWYHVMFSVAHGIH